MLIQEEPSILICDNSGSAELSGENGRADPQVRADPRDLDPDVRKIPRIWRRINK